VGEWKGVFCLFYSGKGDVPFDVFAAAFYLLSLYEEYFPERIDEQGRLDERGRLDGQGRLDEHGRFDHRASTLFREGVLETPVVDRWAYLLKEALEAAGAEASVFWLREYSAIGTYDVDHPYLYKYKGLIKNGGGLLRDGLKGDWRAVGERISVLLRRAEDPYMQALRWLVGMEREEERFYYVFVLLGKRGKYGRSTVYSPKAYYQYLRGLEWFATGLHPSYRAAHTSQPFFVTLNKERAALERILGRPVSSSRQHFLQMETPFTFRTLQQAGIGEDFTLAFAKAPGFRSGTAIPHYFYDVERDLKTNLWLHPTVMMDSTLIFHLKLSPEAALKKIKALIDACRQSGGDYVSLWHNSNLAGRPEENPWIEVFMESRRYAISQENN
jgi:hypothetical protein